MIFLINIPIAIATDAIAILLIPKGAMGGKRVPVDSLGGALCVLGLGGVVYALIEQPTLGWSHWSVAGGLVAGFACLAGFGAWGGRAPAPRPPATDQCDQPSVGCSISAYTTPPSPSTQSAPPR